jgi:hypothetical protein
MVFNIRLIMSLEDNLHKIIFDSFKGKSIKLNPGERLIVERLISRVAEDIEDGVHFSASESIEPALENFKKFADSIQDAKESGEGNLAIPQKFDPERIRMIVDAVESVKESIRELDPPVEPIDPSIWPGGSRK